MKLVFCLLICFQSIISYAQTKKLPEKTVPTNEAPPVQAPLNETLPETTVVPSENIALVDAPHKHSTKVLRGLSQYTGSLHLSPFSTWLPMKYGLALGAVLNENWTIEGEYTQKTISASVSSVDFGEVKDKRYGIQSRWYPGSNSFHFIMGLYKSEFSAEVGNSILDNIGTMPSSTLIKIESIGPQLGLANRWQWTNGIHFGVDWFVMYVPLFNQKIDDAILDSVNNSDDQDDLDKAIAVISKIPQFDVLKLQLGYSF
ncbi:MAG: hypothetical protein ACAH59_09545 [Pseudobdellovibrionaceae bacterium]